MDRPDLSFVIPTYNEEKVIQKTLEQFVPYRGKYSFEIIVVDGKSTDRTAIIARRYTDKVIVEKEKTTIANGRNLGARAARAGIVIEMDAEVVYSSLPLLIETIDAVFADPTIVAATPRFFINPWEANWKDHIIDWVMNVSITIGVLFGFRIAKGECQIFRKQAFDAVGGYPKDMPFGEDADLFAKLRKYGNIRILKGIKAYNSPRRFRRYGYFRVLFIDWFWNWLYLIITGKPFFKKWRPAR